MIHFCHEFGAELRAYKGGGGGGSAGKVEFPAYIETIHSKWLDHTATDAVTNSVVDELNTAVSGNPWTGATPYDPSTDITAMLAELATLDTQVGLMLSGTGLDTLMSSILSDTWVTDEVDAFADRLDAQLAADVYPRFEAGMRDINAVVSSAFAIGRSMIEDGRNREVSQFNAQMQGSTKLNAAVNLIQITLQEYRALAHMTAEMYRLKVDWEHQETTQGYEFDEADARFPLEMFQFASNVLAAPQGAASYVPKRQEGIGKGQAAMSGAMAGASIGTAVDPGPGTAIGAFVGGVAGYLAA